MIIILCLCLHGMLHFDLVSILQSQHFSFSENVFKLIYVALLDFSVNTLTVIVLFLQLWNLFLKENTKIQNMCTQHGYVSITSRNK